MEKIYDKKIYGFDIWIFDDFLFFIDKFNVDVEV